MLIEGAGFAQHRLSLSERTHWRFLLAIAGALLILLSYCLPMFSARISAATTRFTKTVVAADFTVLIVRQHFAQASKPLNENLVEVELSTAPVAGLAGSGWGWLARVAASGRLFVFASFFLCLLLPVLVAALSLLLVGLAWWREGGFPELLIVPSINLATLAPVGLLLAWMHQYDFSGLLLAQARGALTPRIGFWGAMLGMALALVSAWSFRRETRRSVTSWWTLVFVSGFCVWALTRFQPQPFLEIWDFIYDGILVTLRLVLVSFGFILLVSLLGGLGRISRSKVIYGLASLYVEVIRGIPLLVQLLFIWFALPQVFDVLGELLIALSLGLANAGQALIDLRLDPFVAAVTGFTICYGAYGSEIFRAGISSIHHGQMEAARSLGMTYVQAMRYIVLPQAIRVILPPIGNEFVALLKDSSLVSMLAVSDLTRRGREYMARTFLSFDTWLLVALCYLVLTLFSSRVVEFIESKSRFER